MKKIIVTWESFSRFVFLVARWHSLFPVYLDGQNL